MAQLVEHRAVTREVVSSSPAGPTLRVCLCNYICKWLDFQGFSDKDDKPEVPSHNSSMSIILWDVKEPTHLSLRVQYVAQFPATLVCNRPSFLFMHGNFLIFLQETVHLLTFKVYGDRLPTSSTKEIMPFFAKLATCPHSIRSTKRTSNAISMWLSDCTLWD